MTKADQLNAALKSGKHIAVTTGTRRIVYKKSHAGWFFMQGDELRVKNGKGSLFLGNKAMQLVQIHVVN